MDIFNSKGHFAFDEKDKAEEEFNKWAGTNETKGDGHKSRKKLPFIKVVVSICVMGAGIIMALITKLSVFVTDGLLFKELGYLSVFFKELVTKLQIGIPTFIIVTLLMAIYLKAVNKNYFNKILKTEATDVKRLRRYRRILSVAFGLIIAFVFSQRLWMDILKFTHSSSFGKKDPIFGQDISFYVFKMPFLEGINALVFITAVLIIAITIIYCAVIYSVHPPQEEEEAYEYENPSSPFEQAMKQIFGLNVKPKQRRTSRKGSLTSDILKIAKPQMCFMAIIIYLMAEVNIFLRQFELLHSQTGTVSGAGFTDMHITLWAYRICMVLAAVGVVAVIVAAKKNKARPAILPAAGIVVVMILSSGLSAIVQNMIVSPDEINKEKPYLKRSIEYTQAAYGLDHVKTKDFKAENTLSADDIKNNDPTISNIRINDYKPVKTFYNQTQSIRQYYTFNDVDVDRHVIGGQLTQTYMSTREIDESKINDTWLNKHLKYTHGYGATLSRVDTVTANGQPDVLMKNIPPVSSVEEIRLDRPEIYFGELSNNYAVVNTKEDEFDYPDGSSNKYTKYEGKAGIHMSLLNRIMFSIREKSLKLLISSNINKDSKILIRRNIEDRIKRIMPYLQYEKDPYAVAVNGKLYWIVDAYTTTNYYPYSEPFDETDGTNYIRNSVKVVVDAYNGDVNFYIVDKEDPIANTLKAIYPKLFKSMDKMDSELRKHIRYPHYLFAIQAKIYSRYHMNDVKVFYQNEDQWDIAHEIYGTSENAMEPNYYVAKLPGETDAEFINSIPFTPKSKQNMTALMVARNDGENYGDLVVYQFPKNRTVYGPMQIEAQIDQNPKISQDFSLWSSSGSKYSRGNLFVVPIEDSLLYIEPVYLEASNSAIPEVKRVIVAYGDKIAYESTLKEALQSLFGEEAGANYNDGSQSAEAEKDKPLSTKQLIDKAATAYDEAEAALKEVDFATYGKKLEELGNYIKKLKGNE